MKVEKINHIGIMVRDLEKAAKFFGELFETEFSGPHETKEADVRAVASPLGIEIGSPLLPDGPSTRSLERRGEGLGMLALKVPDLEKAIADMQAHGVRLIGKLNLPSAKVALFHPKDLFGVMIELIEY